MLLQRQAFLVWLSLLAWLLFLMAVAAPAMACGLSLPFTLEPRLPLAVGSRLALLFAASELTGRVVLEG